MFISMIHPQSDWWSGFSIACTLKPLNFDADVLDECWKFGSFSSNFNNALKNTQFSFFHDSTIQISIFILSSLEIIIS